MEWNDLLVFELPQDFIYLFNYIACHAHTYAAMAWHGTQCKLPRDLLPASALKRFVKLTNEPRGKEGLLVIRQPLGTSGLEVICQFRYGNMPSWLWSGTSLVPQPKATCDPAALGFGQGPTGTGFAWIKVTVA